MTPLAQRREWRRSMARFELRKARRLLEQGRADRAAIALCRARIWHEWSVSAAVDGGARP